MFFQKFMENFLHFLVIGANRGAGNYVAVTAVVRRDDMAVDRR